MSQASPKQPVPEDLVELGRVGSAYGVKGWVKVLPYSAQAEVLCAVTHWWLVLHAQTHKGTVAYRVLHSRAHGAAAVAQLEGVTDRDQAEQLQGATVWVSRQAFPPASDDEYYWVDLVGCTLYSNADGVDTLVGVVKEVLDNGAHAILRVLRQQRLTAQAAVQPMTDGKGRPLELLVPFVRAHILHVDLVARRIDSDWPLDD